MKKEKEKTAIQEIEKIRNILGNDYHLGVKYDSKLNVESWRLYRKYNDPDVFFSDDNKPIMTSDDYQLEDLYNYAKAHKKINIVKEFSHFCVILAMISFISCALNAIFLKSSNLTYFLLGFNVCLLISDIVLFSFDQQNFKVEMLELDEIFHKNLKRMIDSLEKAKEKIKNVKEKQEAKIEGIKPQKRKAGRPKKNEKSTTN